MLLVAGALTCAGLSACSPAITAVAGIGLDADGRLIGAVHVCDDDVAEASLGRIDGEDYVSVTTWRRESPMTGTESWQLDEPASGRWERVDGARRKLVPGEEYALVANSHDYGSQSNAVIFTVTALARLGPGQLLVPRVAANGDEELAVIPIDSLADEGCS